MIDMGYHISMSYENTITFDCLEKLIQLEKIEGAQLTFLIEDVQRHHDVASRLKDNSNKKVFRDLLSQLIKTYGH
tara:strand:- start:439 stop:663 length:225 start_codon:yes stop_codon:yes gene_type:complete